MFAALALAGTIIGAYMSWKRTIEGAILAQANVEKLETALEQANKTVEDMKKAAEAAAKAIKDAEIEKDKLEEKLQELEKFIDTSPDRESSDVLKDTVRRLRK